MLFSALNPPYSAIMPSDETQQQMFEAEAQLHDTLDNIVYSELREEHRETLAEAATHIHRAIQILESLN